MESSGSMTSSSMTYKDSVIQLIKEHHCQEVAEIGIFHAVLAQEVVKQCHLDRYYLIDPWRPFTGEGTQPWVEEITLDSWDDMCLEAYRAFVNCPEVRIIRLDSVRASKLFEPESLDMVFIDADHSYESALQDIQAWLPIIRSGGIISGHDYGTYKGVVRAVNETFKKKVQRLPGSVWYVEKNNVETGSGNIGAL